MKKINSHYMKYFVLFQLPMYAGIFVAIFGTAYLIHRCMVRQNPLDEDMLQL